MNIGIIGCGNISDVYFQNCKRFDALRVVFCSDLEAARARSKAEQHGVPRHGTTEELLADPGVELVINLTRPGTHHEINLRALEAGKHVYSEKPLAVRRDEGTKLLEAARTSGLRLGCAPDTFMGAALQTSRRVIDAGLIGRPVGATACMAYPGHESWHPDPEFFYQPGGGPLLDMGPYYLTALVHLLGPVRRVTSITGKAHAERVIGSGPRQGTRFPVNVPTHVAGAMEFGNGAVATLVMSFDIWYHDLPVLEVYGTEGSLSLPDPNHFGGTVRLRKARAKTWRRVACAHGYEENSRGVGAADLVRAIAEKRPHRASGELAFHVLDVTQAFHEASDSGRAIKVASRCDRPEPMREGLQFGEL